MNINLKFLLCGVSVCLVPQVLRAQCVASTDCAALGYTENSCSGGRGLRCPFANKWVCIEDCSKGKDNPDCTYGSIYYNDGTCIKEFVSGRIPIGVVVYVDSLNGEKWVMALDDLQRAYWAYSENANKDVSGVENYTLERTVVSDIKNCENTEALLNIGGVAAVAKEYSPEGASATKGKWCLPAAGIFNMINSHRQAIDDGISKAGGTPLRCTYYYSPNDGIGFYWTSSEYSSSMAWRWHVDGNFSVYDKYTYHPGSFDTWSTYCVRPVMKI